MAGFTFYPGLEIAKKADERWREAGSNTERETSIPSATRASQRIDCVSSFPLPKPADQSIWHCHGEQM